MSRREPRDIDRMRLLWRLFIDELLDEQVPAGELVRIARSVRTSFREYLGDYSGARASVHPKGSPKRELAAFSDALVTGILEGFPSEEEEEEAQEAERSERRGEP